MSRRKHDQLRREIAAGIVKAATPKQKDNALADALRNVARTATRVLDEAGVPDHLQGEPGDWDISEEERDFNA